LVESFRLEAQGHIQGCWSNSKMNVEKSGVSATIRQILETWIDEKNSA
jgi:hypothetical protein